MLFSQCKSKSYVNWASLSPTKYNCYYAALDQGIIKNLKHYYRKKLVEKIILEIDSGASVHGNKCPDGLSLARKISILDAISILFDSWSEVSIQIICNFFIKSFKNNESIEDNDFEIKEIPTLFESNELYNQYLAIDDQLATEEELKDKDIINEMNSEKVEKKFNTWRGRIYKWYGKSK